MKHKSFIFESVKIIWTQPEKFDKIGSWHLTGSSWIIGSGILRTEKNPFVKSLIATTKLRLYINGENWLPSCGFSTFSFCNNWLKSDKRYQHFLWNYWKKAKILCFDANSAQKNVSKNFLLNTFLAISTHFFIAFFSYFSLPVYYIFTKRNFFATILNDWVKKS